MLKLKKTERLQFVGRSVNLIVALVVSLVLTDLSADLLLAYLLDTLLGPDCLLHRDTVHGDTS